MFIDSIEWRLPAALLAVIHCSLLAQESPTAAKVLPQVTVTATRTEAASFDIPASIDRIDGDDVRNNRWQVNLSESLGSVPGLIARDRQNYAQDVQISVRGFGSRSTFGIRGVRLYVDGIPATLPDGQGQISHVDLGTTDRIEVLRGPFSALYGNSSGGVVQVFTEEGRGPPTVMLGLAGGSDDAVRASIKAVGSNGSFGYVVGASRFHTDGYREHSAAQRDIGNVKLSLKTDSDGKLTFIANSVALPKAQDPLGLTRAQFDANPRSVDPVALSFDTRKTVEQTQFGALYERKLNASNALRLMVYAGHRGTVQFQAIPTAPQNNPLHPGGMIELGRDYTGTDLRWTLKSLVADAPLTVVAGLDYDALKEHRRGYQNFVGTTTGVQGALRRDENNDVSNIDQYLQASWQFASRWKLDLGVRHSSVRFNSKDNYIVGTNGDDSGSLDFSATLPVAALMIALTENMHLYAGVGRGYETPTLNELAYRPDGTPGLNLALKPSRSDNLEAGIKWHINGTGELTAALFHTRTTDEIVTQTNTGGRSTFQNAGSTKRDGLELSWSAPLREDLRAQASYTLLDARYRDAFANCASTPCAAPNQIIPAGNRIPGTARHSLFAGLTWAPPTGWRAGVDLRALSRVEVNDLNSDAAGACEAVGASLGYVLRQKGWELRGFGRLDSLFDRKYAGSVIVNEGNSRFFEPAPGRTWIVGVSGSLEF